MPVAPRSTILRRLSVAALLVGLLALGACGGDDAASGVASLDDNSSTQDTTKGTASSEDVEADLQKWVECMRENGVDIPDPTTDENGNLTLRPPEGAGPGGGGGTATDDAQTGDGQNQVGDRDAMDAAREACGDPPEGAMGGFERNGADSQEFQDAALEFAQCMRDNGVDMADPVFEAPSTDGARPEGGPRLFGDGGVDPDDPAVANAMEACNDIMPRPAGGGPGSQSGSGSTSSNSASSAG